VVYHNKYDTKVSYAFSSSDLLLRESSSCKKKAVGLFEDLKFLLSNPDPTLSEIVRMTALEWDNLSSHYGTRFRDLVDQTTFGSERERIVAEVPTLRLSAPSLKNNQRCPICSEVVDDLQFPGHFEKLHWSKGAFQLMDPSNGLAGTLLMRNPSILPSNSSDADGLS
jgi:hypothetical protein